MNIPIFNSNMQQAKELTVNDEVFNYQFNEDLIHQTLVWFTFNSHQRTYGQKTRSEVSGGGKKPWRQKGTGHARAGTIRSPLWRKGGVIFAKKPTDYKIKINRKMYRSALKSVISELLRQDRLCIVESINITSHKTRDFLSFLKDLKLDVISNRVVFIDTNINQELRLSSRNIKNINVSSVHNINYHELIAADKVIITEEAIKILEGTLS